MIIKKIVLVLIFSVFLILSSGSISRAAVFYLVPDSGNFNVGQEFIVDIKADTDNISVNAAQATITFPSNILILSGVERDGSIFNFWAEEPVISNEKGTLKFIGGTTKGISGASLQVLRMKFKASGMGFAELNFSDAAIIASDGKGTNILSAIRGASYGVVAEVLQNEPLEPSLPPEPEKEPSQAEMPQIVTRPPVEAAKLPVKPKLMVPLYPDESRWYNHLGEVVAFWEVPADVVKVAADLDQNPGTSPENIEKALLNGKSFGQLQEGIWYLHIQFRNNVGWGPEAHYRIALDTTPPVAFEVGVDNTVSDNPTPTISYESFDSLSGIEKALIYFDGKEFAESLENSLIMPPQPPGEHVLKVKISDKAGNSVEDDLEFEILSLQAPIIEFITKKVSRDESVFISGTALPSSFIDLRLYNKSGQEIISETSQADILGKWALSLSNKDFLPLGEYGVTAVTRDGRGALSYPSDAKIRVGPKAIMSFGPLDLGWFEIFIIVVSLVIAGTSLYGWYYLGLKRKRESYAAIAARDVEKMHDLLAENLEKIEYNIKKLGEGIDQTPKIECLAFIARMKEVLDKIKKYLKKEVEELK